jgi:predicted alpha/beta hydrolase family esterase
MMERSEAPTHTRCIILHGCPDTERDSTYDQHWIPWAVRELRARGVSVALPRLPEPWNPDYDRFKARFEHHHIDKDAILIGHSCSASFLVRWLAESNQHIAQLILVAPWREPDHPSRSAFYRYPIDPKIANHVGRITIFSSDDEEPIGIETARALHEALGGELIILEKHGHYTYGDMHSEAFPELIETILASDENHDRSRIKHAEG